MKRRKGGRKQNKRERKIKSTIKGKINTDVEESKIKGKERLRVQ